MHNMRRYIYIICVWTGIGLLLTGCDLLQPGEVQNPNVIEDDFASSSQAMQTWVNGTNAEFGTCISTFAEVTGLLSDDLYNNSSRSAKTADALDFQYTSDEVADLSTCIGKMIEMADFGLETVAKRDATTTAQQRFNLCYVKAIAYLMASENFVALPASADGDVLTSEGLAKAAVSTLDQASVYAASADDEALVALLKARAYRLCGQTDDAAAQADSVLRKSPTLLVQATFDDINGYANSLQQYVATGLFTVLPRLQMQKVKCPQAGLYEQPIAVAKAEEAYLILAEMSALNADYVQARKHLADLVQAVAERNDSTVSVLSLSADDLSSVTDRKTALETIYRSRQEIFFAEGRRSADMGIRMPMSEVEYVSRGNLPSIYIEMHIPDWLLPIKDSIDSFADLNSRLVESM